MGEAREMLHQKTVDAICARAAKRLRTARIERGLSMNNVAEKAGLSQQMVSYVERGICKPTLETLVRMGWALELDIGKLISDALNEMASRKSDFPKD